MRTDLSCSADERLCSIFSKRIGEDPIGTAGQYDTYLMVEMAWSGCPLQLR